MIEANTHKPLLLIFPFNVLAHYLRCLKLARYLSNYFQVQFQYSARYASFINVEGYATFECASLDPDQVMDGMRRFDFSWLNKNDLETVYLSQAEVIETLRPAFVLGDSSPTLKMAAESAGVTYIALMNGYMSRHYAQVHPMPNSHPLYNYLKILPVSMAGYFIEFGEQLSYKGLHHPFGQIRAKYGLAKKNSYQDETEGDINLICDLPELYPQKSLPANYHFIPPLFYDDETSAKGFAKRLKKNRKTIFVSMGSTGDWNNVAFLNHPFFEQYNIITSGDDRKVICGESVIRAAFTNIHDVFPHTDLVICHGGNGTVYQALLYGLPLLCKTYHFEQQWNADMLERFNYGRNLDRLKTPDELNSVVAEWIDAKNRPNLVNIQQQLQQAQNNAYDSIDRVMKAAFGAFQYHAVYNRQRVIAQG